MSGFSPFAVGDITLYLKSLLCTPIIKPLSIEILGLVSILMSILYQVSTLFLLKHKSGIENKVVMFSIINLMLILFSMMVICFEVLNYASLGHHLETS